MSQETCRALGIQTVSDVGRKAKILNRAQKFVEPLGDCIEFPYPNVPGYSRLRPDSPRVQKEQGETEKEIRDLSCGHNYGGSSDPGPTERTVKYESPLGSDPHWYIPVKFCPSIADPKVRLYITEGEKKSALMCQEGVPCVSVPGVSAGHDLEHRRHAQDRGLDEWQLPSQASQCVVRGREVCTIFDTPDLEENVQVIRANVRLCKMIDKAGAVPLVGYVPAVTGLTKVGVDDYYVRTRKSIASPSGYAIIDSDFGEARPPFPNELLGWLVEQRAEHGWAKQVLMVELRRAAAWVRVWHEHDQAQWKKWTGAAAKKLFVSADEIVQLAAHLAVKSEKKKTKVKARTFSSLCDILRDPSMREIACGRLGKLELDSRTLEVFLGRKAFGSETDISAIRETIAKKLRPADFEGDFNFAKEDVFDALALVASEKRFNPIQEYLEGLKWDGTKRIQGLQESVLKVSAGRRSELNAVFLRKWFISAVARALKPGCKVDTVPILVGTQGVKKSTFFSILGGDWFTDSPIDIGSKDGMLLLAKMWIIEWAELDSMLKARSQNTVKAFVSSREDTFRAPYGRKTVTVPRSSVFVGTTNDEEFLTDETGNRRYWPINGCGAQFDLEKLRVERDQLWAEAVAAYRAGEQWWLTVDEEKQLAKTQVMNEQHDAWTETIEPWLASRNLVQVGQVLTDALGTPAKEINRSDQMRVVKVLKRLGWEVTRIGNKKTKYYYPKNGNGCRPPDGIAEDFAN